MLTHQNRRSGHCAAPLVLMTPRSFDRNLIPTQCRFVVLPTETHTNDGHHFGVDSKSYHSPLFAVRNAQARANVIAAQAPEGKCVKALQQVVDDNYRGRTEIDELTQRIDKLGALNSKS